MPRFFVAAALLCLLCCAGLRAVCAAPEEPSIVIDIPSRTLTLYSGARMVKEYPVGIGRPDQQTPVGTFTVVNKEVNPIWIKPVKEGEEIVVIASGPENPLGYRWIEFAPLYGVHGTNRPDSIGGYVSNGCVRMNESDVEELYAIVPVGTPVSITYERVRVKRNPDQSVTLFVYPDRYQRASVDLLDIERKLAACGAAGYFSGAQLAEALEKSDGKPLTTSPPISVMVYGKQIEAKGFWLAGERYLPVVPVATELKLAVSWDAPSATLSSAYGSAPGYVRNDILYVKAADAYALYQLRVRWKPERNQMQLDTYLEDL